MDAASQEPRRTAVTRKADHDDAAAEGRIGRRALFGAGARGLAALSTLGMLESLAWAPERVALAAPKALPSVQFDLADYIAPSSTTDAVLDRVGPVYTLFATYRLGRASTRRD